MSKEFPIYYKNVEFITVNGNKHVGYLEPPFSDEDNPWFSVENNRDERQGVGGIMFHPENIISWKYI